MGIDPNSDASWECVPLGNAAEAGSLETTTILLEYGADVNGSPGTWSGPPLQGSLPELSLLLKDTSHYLLSKGADPRLTNACGESTWQKVLQRPFGYETCLGTKRRYLFFIDMEGELAHLLWHNADPFELSTVDYHDLESIDPMEIDYYDLESMDSMETTGFDIVSFGRQSTAKQIRAIQTAQAWSYSATKSDEPSSRSLWGTVEDGRSPRLTFAWSDSGVVYQPDLDEVATNRSEDVYVDVEDDIAASASEDDGYEDPETIFGGADRHTRDLPGFFRNETRFYRHISTGEGRRQLSSFPMVRALCDALQHAGYRAEMDDDGDIWYDADGDGDRYFDAREYQPAVDRDDWLVGECPICQDFEGYGLGHIPKAEDNAKQMIREYKQKISKAKSKRNYF